MEDKGETATDVRRRADKSACLDRAHDEYCRLLAAGETPDLDEFCAGYPTFKSSLRRLLDAHQFLEGDPDLLAEHGAVTWPELGEAFLGFTLLAELGRGAFGRVFLANQSEMGGRLVAVKVSLQGAPEAETLGRLSHPNIVTVHSMEEDPFTGLSAICMPFLGRATLCDVLDRAFGRPGGFPRRARVILDAVETVQQPGDPVLHRPPPDSRLRDGTYIDGALHLVAQLADALAFTHEQGICHRDLKPSNVLVTPDGRPMLLDFNLSSDERGVGQPLGGTLPYMAPEQLRATDPDGGGDPSSVGPSADLFSLGVILYELLAGKHPFGPLSSHLTSQDLRAYLLERQRQGPVPLRRVNPSVDRPLARLVERCLAPEPGARVRSAKDLAAALRKSQSRPGRVRRWFIRHGRALLASAVLTMFVGAAGAYGLSLREPYAQRQYRAGVEAYLRQDDPEAIEYLTRVLETDPELAPRAWFLRGRCHQRLGNLRAAVDNYESADPSSRDADVQACLAWCWSLRKAQYAVANYFLAREAGANSAEFFNNWGRNCWLAGREHRAKAESYLNRAIELDPNLPAARHNRAVLVHLEKALAVDKPPHEATAPLALKALDLGIADIEVALQLGPPTTELYREAARIHGYAASLESNPERRAARKQRALALVCSALVHGQDPEELKRDPLLRVLRAELRDLTPPPSPAKPTRAMLFVDPVPDLFNRSSLQPTVAR